MVVFTSTSSRAGQTLLEVSVAPKNQRIYIQVYNYPRHVIGAKYSPFCANYALKQVGIDNDEIFPIGAKAIQNEFYMNDFIKSIGTPEEEIVIFGQLRHHLWQHGFELKK